MITGGWSGCSGIGYDISCAGWNTVGGIPVVSCLTDEVTVSFGGVVYPVGVVFLKSVELRKVWRGSSAEIFVTGFRVFIVNEGSTIDSFLTVSTRSVETRYTHT